MRKQEREWSQWNIRVKMKLKQFPQMNEHAHANNPNNNCKLNIFISIALLFPSRSLLHSVCTFGWWYPGTANDSLLPVSDDLCRKCIAKLYNFPLQTVMFRYIWVSMSKIFKYLITIENTLTLRSCIILRQKLFGFVDLRA